MKLGDEVIAAYFRVVILFDNISPLQTRELEFIHCCKSINLRVFDRILRFISPFLM